MEAESKKILDDAQKTRADADIYAEQKRSQADEAAAKTVQEADQKATRLVAERRAAAQKEIDGLQAQIHNLQEREAAITSRVDELRAIFSQAFGAVGPFAGKAGQEADEGQAMEGQSSEDQAVNGAKTDARTAN